MGRKTLIFIVVLALFCLPLAGAGRMGVCADTAVLQDAFLGKGSYQVMLDLRTMVSSEFQVRIPMSVVFSKTSYMFEVGVTLVCFPWETGPFMGISMFQIGMTGKCPDLENLVNLNEVIVGWSFEFGPGLFVEPAVVIRDPSGTFSDEYSRIKGTFPCYTTFRGRLGFGWYFWR
jgi:hypothetical protein